MFGKCFLLLLLSLSLEAMETRGRDRKKINYNEDVLADEQLKAPSSSMKKQNIQKEQYLKPTPTIHKDPRLGPAVRTKISRMHRLSKPIVRPQELIEPEDPELQDPEIDLYRKKKY